ncbi:hypothetical protein CDAR_74891 [Caerostris darwini]|uniref:Uncharacterized protein n=1 Tax=Caerostris darwini TaxID=1538125 RepID=A0AAV4P1L6_9ARAC|nr:hypothetical protein CDAR_74891 [Caerostris darwini]
MIATRANASRPITGSTRHTSCVTQHSSPSGHPPSPAQGTHGAERKLLLGKASSSGHCSCFRFFSFNRWTEETDAGSPNYTPQRCGRPTAMSSIPDVFDWY